MDKPVKKRSSDTVVVVMMLLALGCVGITLFIAYLDMSP